MQTGYSESRQLVATMYRTHILFSIFWCGMLLLSVALFRTSAATSCRSGKRLNDTHSDLQNAVDGACGSLDIRNSITMLRLLDNCTVVEGTLHISLIDHYNEKDYEQYQFPLLREITGHLLIYRVYGLKTLRHMFPNLAVIRGQDLFYNYALVVYEMPDLEELGLISLTTIMRGAVRLTKNTRLCYVNTIDWSHIAVGLKDTDHHIQDNKDQTKCVNYCPDNCTKTIVDGENARRCWTAHHCQKNLDCNCKRTNVDNPRNCLEGTNKCCSIDCVGGCREVMKDGKKTEQCIACSRLWQKNTCVHKCAPNMATYMNHRCLTVSQCHNLTHATKHNNGWLVYKADSSTWFCVDECPAGYFVNPEERSCEKCNNSCPKICQGRVVDSIDTAQKLKGCNKIINSLEIHIMGGSNIGVELEESLGSIEEVMHDIKIIRSYALMSLYFFKNLRVIHGLSSGSASLVVRDNSNLQELFTEEVTRNLRILKGNVHFHSNRKLCLNKIDDLVKTLGLNVTEHDVSRTTNGDLMPCTVTKFNVTVSKVSSHIALVTWPKVPISDQRQLLSYIIYFREVTTDTVNIYQGRDACSDTIWKTIEISPEDDQDLISHVIPNLKPWTRYAVYVQAQMLSTASSQTISEIQIFRTSPFYPTSPTDLEAVAKQPTELHVSWKPPKFPNGKITHYILYYKMQEIHADSFNQRDYCTNPIAILKEHKTPTEQEQIRNVTTNNSSCCACPKSKEELIEEQKERQIEIEFENYLHDNVYCKREDDIDPSKIDNKYTFDTLKNLTISRQQRDTSRVDNPLPRYHAEGNLTLANNSTRAPATSASNETHDNTFFQVTILGGATSTVLTNLNHFQEYNIQVVACVDGEVMSNSRSDFCSNRVNVDTRTKPLEDADNINGSTVEASAVLNSTGQVFVTWEAPPKPNGLIIKYLIRYRRANTDHQFETVCVSQRSFLVQRGHRLSKIAAGNYTFQIAAISLAGNGSYTPEKFFIVPDKEIDSSATEIHIVIAVCVISIILIAFIIIVVVWFIAKKRYTNADMTVISQNPGYVPSDELYIPDEWEVPRDKIKLLKELGQGSFGMVYEGKAYDLVDGYSEYKVAIKTVNDNAGFQERMNFLKEATTMKTFKCHHVVKLIGVVSKGQPALVIMELMAKGDLKNYLRMHRPDEEDCVGDPPTTKEILQMAGEIADGMAYLSAKKFVHRDLAARNCMVSENNVVKIGDFGMTRDIYETDYYRKGNKGLLPVRWMAPESLKDGVFTTMSDVWSYGVVMWEMATLACQPYQGLSNEEVVKYVTDGKVMVKPEGCPPKLWSIMEKCWQYRPKNRPTFMSIIEELVPDLDPSFQNVSYFFSEESHGDDGEGARNAILDMEEEDEEEAAERESMLDADADDGVDEEFYEGMEDDVDDVRFAGLDSFERDVCVPFISGEELGHHPLSSSQPMSGGHFSSPTSPAHHSPSHGNRGASSSSWLRGAGASRGPSSLVAGAGAGSGSGSPVECMLLEELPNGHHRFTPPCSSPTSANASSDDSKGSSKSSTGSYSHMNGLANGHIYKPYAPRMKPC